MPASGVSPCDQPEVQIVSRFIRLGVVALVVCAAGRRHFASVAVDAQPESGQGNWSLVDSPYGPGAWLAESRSLEVAHAFVPPGARAFHDESDLDRQRWRHLTIDPDLGVRPTVTVLDTHEVYTMVPSAWGGWVLEQSIRHSDGTVRGADLLQSLRALGLEPELLDGALRVLGGTERIRAQLVWDAACVIATHVAADCFASPVSSSHSSSSADNEASDDLDAQPVAPDLFRQMMDPLTHR
jgi:hypothetical protein